MSRVRVVGYIDIWPEDLSPKRANGLTAEREDGLLNVFGQYLDDIELKVVDS